MEPSGRAPVSLPRLKPPVAHHRRVLCEGSTLNFLLCELFSVLNTLQGIKGDRGPAGTNGDKGEKVGTKPPGGLIQSSVMILLVNLWGHHFNHSDGIHAVQLKVVSLSFFTGTPRAPRPLWVRRPTRKCCTLHFNHSNVKHGA